MGDQVFFVSQVGAKGSPERIRADDVHDGIVDPVAKQFGMTVHRADRDATPGQVTAQIVRALIEARIVVADLTGRNPNVYYELGVAHAFQRPVAILVDKATSLSFDTQNEKVIEIGDSGIVGVNQAREAVTRLTEVFKIVLAEDYAVENLLTSVAAARSLDALAPDNPVAAELATMREQLDDVVSIVRRLDRASRKEQSTTAQAFLRNLMESVGERRLTDAELGDLNADRAARQSMAWQAVGSSIADRTPTPTYPDEEPF